LRFILAISGTAQNLPFTVSLNGVNVLYTGLQGTDFFHNIELQFPVSLVNGPLQTLAFACDCSGLQGAVPSFQWSIGQVAITYSNAPIGFIFNSYNGGFSPIANSYYTPLMGIFYGNSFPGYAANQQPIWLPYVQNGQFHNGIDIIALNNIILNLGAPAVPLSNALSGLSVFMSNNFPSVFTTQTQTALYLVGDNFDFSRFTSPSSFSLLHINSIPVIGYFNPSCVVSTVLEPLSSTQSIAVRFSLFLLGETINAPLMITVNGQSVLNVPIVTSSYFQNVEVVFPYTAGSQPVLAITFGSTNTPFQWAMSQFAVSYSNAPCGNIYNTCTGGNVPLTTGYFTPLLQNQLGGSFPGYSAAQQPIWLSYVLNGQFNNANDIIVVNRQLLNFALASPFSIRNALIQSSFLTQCPTILELTGSSFTYPSFSISTGSLSVTTISSIPALGYFAPGSILSYQLAPLATTQSINLRFLMFVSGTVSNVPLVLTANNVEIMSVPLSGTNFFRNIEIQFPYTIGAASNVLTWRLGDTEIPNCQWAISQMAVSYSNAPVGFILNALSLGYSPIQGSFYTPALNNFYGSSFPGYTAAQQPLWLPYVLNGQFRNTCDMISLNGNMMNFAPYTLAHQSALAADFNCDFASLKVFQNSFLSTIMPQISSVLELVGLNFNTNAFSFNSGNFGLNYVENIPVLGNFMPSTIVSYSLAPLASTQAIVVRFNLHTIGTVSAMPFTVAFNGVNYLNYPITSTNSLHYVEVNFPYTSASSNVLSISFAQPAQGLNNFQWAIGQFAVTYSNAPCGLVMNTATGEYNAITSSFHSMTLPTYYNGIYPGYASQPTWAAHVLNGQFVNSVDIIAINGDVLNFGRMAPSSVGIMELASIPQGCSSILNYQPYTMNVGNQFQYGGVTQNMNGLFNFSPLMIDLVGSPLSNLNEWTVSSGSLNTISLNGINLLGYFSPNVILTRQYLNLGNYNSLGVIFQLNVASPTGFNFRVQANGITILQQPLQAGTYSRIMETHFEIAEQNVVLTFGATVDSGVSLTNAGGWAIGSVGFLSNQCDIRNFFNLNVNRCQYAGNSVFHALTFVNFKQGFAQLTAQPTWYQSFITNNIGAANQMFFINNVNIPYLTGTESALVAPVAIHQAQYALLGGNHIQFDLVGSRFNLPAWSLNTGLIQTTTIGGVQALGLFNVGQVLTGVFDTPLEHATIVLRFRLHGVGSWNNLNFYTMLGNNNGPKILTRDITLNNDFRDIELQFTHSAPTLSLVFGINAGSATIASGTGFAISNLVLHMNPCSVLNTYNVLLNTCMEAGNTGIYSLYRSDYFGQFFGNLGLNLIYLNKFQGLFGLRDDGREIYSSWTGDNVFTGKVLLELSGPNFDFSNWQVRGTRTAPYTSQLYGSTAFGPYESGAVLRRVFTGLPAHSTIVGRVRIYLVGSWIDQNTVLQANGVTIFHYVLGTTDNYQDLEFAFDHTGSTLDLSFLSLAGSSAGVRDGIRFGISDLALYVSPCAQKSFFNIGLGSCALTTGYSTFYNLVQTNLAGFFPTVALRPLWLNVLTPVSGISGLAQDVYSFLNGDQLQVIMGPNGVPQFVDMNLNDRLKDNIDATKVEAEHPAAADDVSFLYGMSSDNIIGDYNNGTITNYGTSYDNLFGASVIQSGVTTFDFAFGITTGWACVGMIETEDPIPSLDLNAAYRDSSKVVCTDKLTQPKTKFTVSLDTDNKSIIFQDQFYADQSTTLTFNNADNLYFTVQFFNKGAVYFGQSADSYTK